MVSFIRILWGFNRCAIISGVTGGKDLVTSGARSLQHLLRTGQLTPKFVKAMALIKTAAKVLFILGFVLDSILLIYELIEGEKQKIALQEGIVELCARRLTVKKIQQSVRVSNNFVGDAKYILDSKKDLDEYVRDGLITQEQANQRLRQKMDMVGTDTEKEMEKITDESAWHLVDDQDTLSGIAWRNEDPTLAGIEKWLEEHPDD